MRPRVYLFVGFAAIGLTIVLTLGSMWLIDSPSEQTGWRLKTRLPDGYEGVTDRASPSMRVFNASLRFGVEDPRVGAMPADFWLDYHGEIPAGRFEIQFSWSGREVAAVHFADGISFLSGITGSGFSARCGPYESLQEFALGLGQFTVRSSDVGCVVTGVLDRPVKATNGSTISLVAHAKPVREGNIESSGIAFKATHDRMGPPDNTVR